ncbi:MAG TPA: Hsp20/alpha crystallin family protein [Longimicrobiales bacterium]|jgi:HSP20 family protein|nr:Hsp20/alpha crystallin family protein [Longimicrobiales bacterium]
MAIIKYPFRNPTYAPWRELDEVSSRLARLFDDASLRRANGGMWTPPVTVSETPDELVFTAELPGLSEEQVAIELENDVLTISGEKSEERTEGDEERNYHLWERSYGSFRRSFSLPRAVSADQATARFDKGVLEIRLPKAPEAKGRKIEISKS